MKNDNTEIVSSKESPEWTPETGYQEALQRIEDWFRSGRLGEMLTFSGLALKRLPPEIGQLTGISGLDLSDNHLTELPPEIGKLTRLSILELANNRFSNFPTIITDCLELAHIDLTGNQLKSIPPQIEQFSNRLSRLELCGNQLQSLPPEIGKLEKIEFLDVSRNRLTQLPQEIGKLSQLVWLNASNNRLTRLPVGLLELDRLSGLYLHGNPGLNLGAEALGPTIIDYFNSKKTPKPPREILAIYFAQQEGGTRALNEVKIILVGRGGAGKTSIRNRLVGGLFDGDQQETPGIEIVDWELGCINDSITAHLWDFAGQDITHSTHQFFLTRRSLYLLVVEGRSDSQDRDAEYWLRLIRAFGGESPVIVALNKWDEKPFAVADFTLRQEFPHVRAFVRTDCRTGLGMEELEDTIRWTVAEMESVNQPFPKLWFEVKEKMASMTENYLPLLHFREICRERGVVEIRDQNALAGHLHDLGIILHYADDERLLDTTVLNPRWVTGSVYTLLRYVENRQTQNGDFTGKLTLKEASTALVDERSDMVRYLVGLMERFELCYSLEGRANTWLIPQLLSPHTPDALGDRWFHEQSTRLRYTYNILPEGLLPRFIVRTHPLVSANLVWRQGVVLEMEDNGYIAYALVIAEPGRERIQVTVIGEDSARLRLTKLIRAHFQDIHEDFNRRKQNGGKLENNLDALEQIEVEGKLGVFVDVATLLLDEKGHNITTVPIKDLGSIRVDQSRVLDRLAAREGKERRKATREPFETPRKLFLSYSHADAPYRDVFMQNLKVMESDGIIESWYDGKLLAGESFDGKIRQAMENADIIVFLISTASLASKYIREVEIKAALRRLERKTAMDSLPIIVPILLEKDCAWKVSSKDREGKLDHLQIIPGDDKGNIKAVDQWPSRRKAFNAVEQAIRKLLS